MTNYNTYNIFEKQEHFFRTKLEIPVEVRINLLKDLKRIIVQNRELIIEALRLDLNRSVLEAEFEFSVVAEIDYLIKNLKSWLKPVKTKTEWLQFPARNCIQYKPLGPTLIIAPWNYPIELTLKPLVGAIAAGNPIILKPSELAPNCANLLAEVINNNFNPEYIRVILGDVDLTTELLKLPFKHIFFTGSSSVGKIVYQAAATNLAKCTLELGGKSPAIICDSANLAVSVRRILWGKLINAGQTCIAPDYLFVDRKIYPKVLELAKQYLDDWFKEGYLDFCKIISPKHYQRLLSLLKDQQIVYGGGTDDATLQLYPTLVKINDLSSPLMQEEIFGPILPIVIFDAQLEVVSYIQANPSPLALYVFSKHKRDIELFESGVQSGAVVINDVILHQVNRYTPFGGVGASGLGAYHGRFSFDTFSYQQTQLYRKFAFDLPQRYRPYTKFKQWFLTKFI